MDDPDATNVTTSPTAMDTTTDKESIQIGVHPSAQSSSPRPQTHAPGFEPAPTADPDPIQPRDKFEFLLLPADVQATVCTKIGNKQNMRLACKALQSAAAPDAITISFTAVRAGKQHLADAEKVARWMPTVKAMVIKAETNDLADMQDDLGSARPAFVAFVEELCEFFDEIAEKVKFWPQLESVEMPLNGQVLMHLVSSCQVQSLTVRDDDIEELLDRMLGRYSAGPEGMGNLLPCNNVDHVFSILGENNTITKLRLELSYSKVWPRQWDLLGGMTQLKQLTLSFNDAMCPVEGDEDSDDSDEEGLQDAFGDGPRTALLPIARNVAKLVQLTDLEVMVNKVADAGTGPWSLSNLTNLTSLHFMVHPVCNMREIWLVDALQSCTQLRVLKLWAGTENPAPLLSPLRNLTRLDWGEDLTLTDTVADVLATSCPALAYLHAKALDISYSSNAVLPALKVLQLRGKLDCRVPLHQLAPELQLLHAPCASPTPSAAILRGHPSLTFLHVPYEWLPTEQNPAPTAFLMEMTALTHMHLTVKEAGVLPDLSEHIPGDGGQAPEAFHHSGRLNRALMAGWAERIQSLQLFGAWSPQDEYFCRTEHLSVLFSSMPALRSINLMLFQYPSGARWYADALANVAKSCLSKMKLLTHVTLPGSLLVLPEDARTERTAPLTELLVAMAQSKSFRVLDVWHFGNADVTYKQCFKACVRAAHEATTINFQIAEGGLS